MNERINQLIKQSYITVQFDNREAYTHFSQEKFAELIIRECIGCADIVGKANYTSSYPNSTAYHIKQKIKEHFGVEE